ncbi:MAG TPA: hypothetical protein DEP57_10185 [Selenomonas sp.]|nr:hypothetical protein [Selenomonas sp.]
MLRSQNRIQNGVGHLVGHNAIQVEVARCFGISIFILVRRNNLPVLVYVDSQNYGTAIINIIVNVIFGAVPIRGCAGKVSVTHCI